MTKINPPAIAIPNPSNASVSIRIE